MTPAIEAIKASNVVCWVARHGVRDAANVDAIYASMDSSEDAFVWSGPALIADIESGRLLTGTHRQAALQRLINAYPEAEDWAVPVIDIWSLIDTEDVERAMINGAEWDEAVSDLMAQHGDSDDLGWDII